MTLMRKDMACIRCAGEVAIMGRGTASATGNAAAPMAQPRSKESNVAGSDTNSSSCWHEDSFKSSWIIVLEFPLNRKATVALDVCNLVEWIGGHRICTVVFLSSAVWPWASHIPFLGLAFLSYKMWALEWEKPETVDLNYIAQENHLGSCQKYGGPGLGGSKSLRWGAGIRAVF